MKDFKIKHLRCEWQVVIQCVDQYGYTPGERREVLSTWPSRDEALLDLPNHGTPHKYVKGRWVPTNFTSEYELLEVQYKEVEISL